MTNKILGIASILGLLTVILGAFGAHSLKDSLDAATMQSFETGVRYMMYHVLALLLINTSNLLTDKSKNLISYLFLFGILLFSGSIFVIALQILPARQIWFITPIGGLLFIAGWLIATISFFKKKHA